jgi:hypothetical protein
MYVCEGPIDSLFLSNCIAVGGTGFGKLEQLGLDKNNLTVILDNQSRNSEVCKIYQKLIRDGYKILMWPEYTTAKDINELVLGTPNLNVRTFVNINSFRNLTAQLKFDSWKRI